MKRRSVKIITTNRPNKNNKIKVRSTKRVIPVNHKDITYPRTPKIQIVPKSYSPISVPSISTPIEFKSNYGTPKIAFMFLTIESLHQGASWYKFLSDGSDRSTVYSHPKYPEHIKQAFLKDNIIPRVVRTQWANLSLVHATNNLLLEALKDSDNKFFMLLSEKCMPLYDFDYSYKIITQQNKSWLFHYKWSNHTQNMNRYQNLMKNSHRHDNPLQLRHDQFYKQSQWMLLNRDHAQIVAANINITNQFYKMSAPDEHFYINVLKDKVKMFHKENINTPITFVNWKDSPVGHHPVDYETVHLNDIRNAKASEYFKQDIITRHSEPHLFMRKVPHSAKIYD